MPFRACMKIDRILRLCKRFTLSHPRKRFERRNRRLSHTGAVFLTMAFLTSPSSKSAAQHPKVDSHDAAASKTQRRYLIEQAGLFAVTQIYADGFERLTPRERVLAYHLAEAGIAGDPIYYDQIAPYGLELKQLLEGIWTHPTGIDPESLNKIRSYTKLVWIQHGNYNLDSARKFLPEFDACRVTRRRRIVWRAERILA